MKFVTVAFCIIATQKVSLFTREWIEIDALHVLDVILMRLPLYEGVD